MFNTDGLYDNDSEALEELKTRKKLVKNLGMRVEKLIEYSKYADTLNNFVAFYNSEISKDSYEDQNNWRLGQFKALNKTRTSCQNIDDEALKTVFEKKIKTIEDKLIGDDEIYKFYKAFNTENPPDAKEVALKCNTLVKELKSIEKFLKTFDPDFKGYTSSEKGARYHRVYSIYTARHPENTTIEKQLQVYLQKHPEGHIESYRGIPYIATKDSKEPLTIPNTNAH